MKVFFKNDKKQNLSKIKKRAVLLSLFSNTLLTLIKLVSGLFLGSISLLSEALHSFGDLMAAFIAFVSIVQSSKPADKEHQFGHSKFEDLAGFIESNLIILSAFFIIYASISKIVSTNSNAPFRSDIAFYIMLVCIVLNYFVGKYLLKIGKETESNALLGDGYHIMTDVVSSVAIALGLFLVNLTGQYILDPIIAIVVAFIILKTGVDLFKKTASALLDESLPNENLIVISSIIEKYTKSKVLKLKSLKTSKAGNIKNIVLEIYFPPDIKLKIAHQICDEIEHALECSLGHTNVVIHCEPDTNADDYINVENINFQNS